MGIHTIEDEYYQVQKVVKKFEHKVIDLLRIHIGGHYPEIIYVNPRHYLKFGDALLTVISMDIEGVSCVEHWDKGRKRFLNHIVYCDLGYDNLYTVCKIITEHLKIS